MEQCCRVRCRSLVPLPPPPSRTIHSASARGHIVPSHQRPPHILDIVACARLYEERLRKAHHLTLQLTPIAAARVCIESAIWRHNM